MLFWAFREFRYVFRRWFRYRWPKAEAVIQQSAVKLVSGDRSFFHAAFFAYAFAVQGVEYIGTFLASWNGEEGAEELAKSLLDAKIAIRYKPADPTISVIDNFDDLRFRGGIASQNPDWLSQAPTFRLSR
jgi:hypothetical protein